MAAGPAECECVQMRNSMHNRITALLPVPEPYWAM